jgi:hypothetical protein
VRGIADPGEMLRVEPGNDVSSVGRGMRYRPCFVRSAARQREAILWLLLSARCCLPPQSFCSSGLWKMERPLSAV